MTKTPFPIQITGTFLGSNHQTPLLCNNRNRSGVLIPGDDASQGKLANQNLRMDLRWVAKRIRKFTQVAKSRKFHAYTVDFAINLCRLAMGGQTVKIFRRLAYEFELDASQRKWVAKRNASRTQVEHLRWLASTCVDLRVRLARALRELFSWNGKRTSVKYVMEHSKSYILRKELT